MTTKSSLEGSHSHCKVHQKIGSTVHNRGHLLHGLICIRRSWRSISRPQGSRLYGMRYTVSSSWVEKTFMNIWRGLTDCVPAVLNIKSAINSWSGTFLRGYSHDQWLIDTASGGTLMDKTLEQARVRITKTAHNVQQYSAKSDASIRGIQVPFFLSGLV